MTGGSFVCRKHHDTTVSEFPIGRKMLAALPMELENFRVVFTCNSDEHETRRSLVESARLGFCEGEHVSLKNHRFDFSFLSAGEKFTDPFYIGTNWRTRAPLSLSPVLVAD